jgi:hypothetical protein
VCVNIRGKAKTKGNFSLPETLIDCTDKYCWYEHKNIAGMNNKNIAGMKNKRVRTIRTLLV